MNFQNRVLVAVENKYKTVKNSIKLNEENLKTKKRQLARINLIL